MIKLARARIKWRSQVRGRTKEMTKELKKEGILLSKPTSYGEEVSINSKARDKIMFYINRFLNSTSQ